MGAEWDEESTTAWKWWNKRHWLVCKSRAHWKPQPKCPDRGEECWSYGRRAKVTLSMRRNLKDEAVKIQSTMANAGQVKGPRRCAWSGHKCALRSLERKLGRSEDAQTGGRTEMSNAKGAWERHVVSQMDMTSNQEIIECDRPRKVQQSCEAETAEMNKAPGQEDDREWE